MRRTSYFRTIARTLAKGTLRLQPRPRLLQRWETIPEPPAASLPDRPAPPPPQFKSVPSAASSAPTHQPDVAPSAPVASPLPLVPALQPPVAPVNRETRPIAPPPHHPASTPAPQVRHDKDPKEQESGRKRFPQRAQAPLPNAAKSAEFAERVTATRIAQQSPPPPAGTVVLQPPAPVAPVPQAPANRHSVHHELHIGSIEVQVLPPAAPPPPPVRRRAAQVSTGSLSRGYYSTFGIGQG
jgi:hypothetical protein